MTRRLMIAVACCLTLVACEARQENASAPAPAQDRGPASVEVETPPSDTSQVGAETTGNAAPPPSTTTQTNAEVTVDVDAGPPPPAPVAQEANYSVVPVFFATNRAPVTNARRAEGRFLNRPGPLSYGKLLVSVPRAHVMGHIERPNMFEGLILDPNPKRHFTIRDFERLTAAQAVEWIAKKMRDTAGSGQKQALIFVHGYNVPFDTAAFRTAQMAYDTGFQGAPVFYSWPSAARETAYLHDASRIEEARPYIKRFISDVIGRAGADRVFIVAHSMGTRGVTRALAELSQERPDQTAKIAALILAAPDINAAVFNNDIAPRLSRMARNVTLYANAEDRALMASRRINGARALGDAGGGIRVFPGMDSIDATPVGTSFLGHSEYGDNPFLLNDIGQVILGRALRERSWLLAMRTPTGAYQFRRVRQR